MNACTINAGSLQGFSRILQALSQSRFPLGLFSDHLTRLVLALFRVKQGFSSLFRVL